MNRVTEHIINEQTNLMYYLEIKKKKKHVKGI